MSTASRYCGSVGGTCGGVDTQHPSPGATVGARGHYDPRAGRHAQRSSGTCRKFSALATNAALPRERAGATGQSGAPGACRCTRPARWAHRAFFPIGLRERPSRHSLPPPRLTARGACPRGRSPP